jgi:hypothetical protein
VTDPLQTQQIIAVEEKPSRWRRPTTAWTLLCATAVLAVGVVATGAPVGGYDEEGVQQVVQTQLQAFAKEDAGTAYELADPTLRTRFGSAEAFLASVRVQYPMMAHPESVLFLKPQSDGTIALQKVRVTDSDGATWLVTYLLNRQKDQQWRIGGCVVEPDGAQVIV